MIRKTLTRDERKTALEFTADELERLVERMRKMDPSDSAGLRDMQESFETIAGSFGIMRIDVLDEENERSRLS